MMDDLISREAAIEALGERPIVWWDNDDYELGERKQYDMDKLAIETVPSTQPEIIRCKDCKHYNAGFECLIEGYGIERSADWYCGDAERREEGEQE